MKTYITARGPKGTALPPLEVRPLRYFNFYGRRCFVRKSEYHDGYLAHEYETGLSLNGGDSVHEAMTTSRAMMRREGREKTERAATRWIKRHGRTNPPEEKKP